MEKYLPSKELLRGTDAADAAAAGAGDALEPVYNQVVRVLSECGVSASKEAIERIALSATIAAWVHFQDGDGARDVLENAVAKMGWPEINAFIEELSKGQSIFEDAGGYLMRCLRRLFGLPAEEDREVVSYRQAVRAMIAVAQRAAADPVTES